MKTVIWPRTDGDLILDLREVISDGVLRPAVVAVDATGAQRGLGKVVEVRDGGGHAELFRFQIADDIGFDQDPDDKVKIHG